MGMLLRYGADFTQSVDIHFAKAQLLQDLPRMLPCLGNGASLSWCAAQAWSRGWMNDPFVHYEAFTGLMMRMLCGL